MFLSRRSWALIGFFLVGVLLIGLAGHYETSHELESEVSRDVGIALCISALIAGLIEIGLAKDMFERGLDVIMKKTVPDEVWDEIKQHVISEPVFRHQVSISMAIAETNGEYVSATTLAYELESLRDVQTHHVRHHVDRHRNVRNGQNTRYRSVTIDGNLQDISSLLSTDKMSVGFDIKFSRRRRRAKVAVEFVEYIDATDTINWWMNTSTKTVVVNVSAPVELGAEVDAHHPAPQLLTGDLASGWTFDGVMLPGQGLEIRVVLPPIAATPPPVSA